MSIVVRRVTIIMIIGQEIFICILTVVITGYVITDNVVVYSTCKIILGVQDKRIRMNIIVICCRTKKTSSSVVCCIVVACRTHHY